MRFLPVLAGVILSAASAFAQNPPVITTSFPNGVVGSFYSVTLGVSGGTAPFSWAVAGAVPSGLTFTAAGLVYGTPTTAGTFSFVVIVTDSRQLTGSKNVSLTITQTGGTSLSIVTTVLPAGGVGQSYSQTLTATGGHSPYQWAVGSGLPAGLTLNGSTGQITGTPTTAGNYSFQVQVTDAANAIASATLGIVVTPPALAIITVSPLFAGTAGVAYSQTFTAAGGTPPYNWSILSGSTGNLALNAASGTLQGTPQSATTLSFMIQVADSAGGRASQAYSITIQAPTLVIALGAALPGGMAGTPYNQIIAAAVTGGTAPYTWSLAGSVPGLSFDPDSLVLSGTPVAAGTYTLTLEVSDSAGNSASRPLNLVIAAQALTIVTGRQLAAANLNAPYGATVTATGGVPPYTWSAVGLPAGLAIDPASGAIGGTPTAAGTYSPVVISVSDSALNHSSDIFTLVVGLPALPGVTISGLPPTADPAQQYTLQIVLASPYSAPITGQAIVSFSPQSGLGDSTIQFAAGGTTASFTIPAGTVAAVSQTPLAIQTGTAAGVINVSLRFQAGGVDITPSAAPSASTAIGTAAPVITGTQVTRTANSITLSVTGYATALQVTQAVFTFKAASGQTLQPAASSVTLDVTSIFGTYFGAATLGSQFVYSQPFTVQGDPTAVIPVSVTLTNRVGAVTAQINQ